MSKKRKFYLSMFIFIAFIVSFQVFYPISLDASSSAKDKVKNDIVLRIGSSKALVNGEFTFIDGDNLNVIPFVKNNVPYIPLRFIVESLGGTISIKNENNFIVSLNNKKIDITAGQDYIMIDGKMINIEAQSFIENGRTFIPVSSLAEVVGKNVFFKDNLVIVSDNKNPLTLPKDNEILNILKAELSVIPSFGTKAEFKSYISDIEDEYDKNPVYNGITGGVLGVMEDSSFATGAVSSSPSASANMKPSASKEFAAPQAAAEPESARLDTSADFSEVNVQVKGVDEADIIRTDGRYIYTLTSNLLTITDAYPASKMEIKYRNTFSNSTPLEMYLSDNKITVISRKNGSINNSYGDFTQIIVLDVSDKEKPKIIKETSINGEYLSSRKINENVYVVTNTNMYNLYRNKNVNPVYYESNKETLIPTPNIYRFPGAHSLNYLTIAGVSLENPNNEPDVNVYIGAGTTIYVSQKYMYIAEPSYNFDYNETINALPWLSTQISNGRVSTIIHKISLFDGKSAYIGSGAVPGTILNQFSMDEYGSYFRIATNANNGNNIYILDSQLKLKSSIEDIAPGERIYSTRFMGNRGYMVTFKTTDPLFAIDLNPENPQILGALKIPGYSDYLHPYDENTLIGFGKDTVEEKDIAYYQGMKMAIFDVSDVSNPKQKFVEIIGSRGTESDLLTDHKALLFDKDKNLLAFPVTVYENGGVSSYGTFKFQGAYVYDISLDKGFVKRGEITHLTADEYKKSGNNWYYSNYDDSPVIKRIIYIGDSLYTLSNRSLMAHSFENVEYQNEVSLIK